MYAKTLDSSEESREKLADGRILVVDDNAANRDLLAQFLHLEDFHVQCVATGEEAVQLADNSRFDLVLLDVRMPGLDGFEVLKIIRETHSASDLPIVMVTGNDASADVVLALELGANDYVTKPLDLPVVLARVQSQLSLKRSMEQVKFLTNHLAEQNKALESTNRRMSYDLAAAARVQQSFLPRSVPKLNGVEFAWSFEPCSELAGDGLNIIPLDAQHVAIYVLDVSGHGVAAALLSVSIARVLSAPTDPLSILNRPTSESEPQRIAAPHEVAARLNELFAFELTNGRFVTLSYGVLNTTTNEFRYISAGHPGPVWIRQKDYPEVLECKGFPIGIAETTYKEHSIHLGAGDRLYLYSDGVTEARSESGELFGIERLLGTIEQQRKQTIASSVTSILDDLRDWQGHRSLLDDVSIVAIQTGPA